MTPSASAVESPPSITCVSPCSLGFRARSGRSMKPVTGETLPAGDRAAARAAEARLAPGLVGADDHDHRRGARKRAALRVGGLDLRDPHPARDRACLAARARPVEDDRLGTLLLTCRGNVAEPEARARDPLAEARCEAGDLRGVEHADGDRRGI